MKKSPGKGISEGFRGENRGRRLRTRLFRSRDGRAGNGHTRRTQSTLSSQSSRSSQRRRLCSLGHWLCDCFAVVFDWRPLSPERKRSGLSIVVTASQSCHAYGFFMVCYDLKAGTNGTACAVEIYQNLFQKLFKNL